MAQRTRSSIGWMACVALLVVLPSAAFAQDGSWTFGNIATTDYRLDAVSSTDIFSGTLPAADPTLNLTLGKRYQATVVAGHPLTILSKGATSATDVILLAQGGTVGSLEGDPGINWVDSGGTVTFTVTQTLVNAMNASGIPGYRCNVHPATMRGNFNIVTPQPVIPIVGEPAWLALALLLCAAAWLLTSRRRAARSAA